MTTSTELKQGKIRPPNPIMKPNLYQKRIRRMKTIEKWRKKVE